MPRKKPSTAMAAVFVWVPIALRDELNRAAAAEGEAASTLVRRMLRAGLARRRSAA